MPDEVFLSEMLQSLLTVCGLFFEQNTTEGFIFISSCHKAASCYSELQCWNKTVKASSLSGMKESLLN